jgi:hypothetical protein
MAKLRDYHIHLVGLEVPQSSQNSVQNARVTRLSGEAPDKV